MDLEERKKLMKDKISEMKELRKNQEFEDTYYYESKSLFSDFTPTTLLNSITRLNDKSIESGKKLNTIYIVNPQRKMQYTNIRTDITTARVIHTHIHTNI